MPEKFSVRFCNISDTKSYEYDSIEIPRLGEYVTIFDNPASGKVILEGNVVRVRWVIVNSERLSSVNIVVDENPYKPFIS